MPDRSVRDRTSTATMRAIGGKLDVNGVGDWNTTQAIKSFQMHVGLVADGVAGPLTRAAITNELSGI